MTMILNKRKGNCKKEIKSKQSELNKLISDYDKLKHCLTAEQELSKMDGIVGSISKTVKEKNRKTETARWKK